MDTESVALPYEDAANHKITICPRCGRYKFPSDKGPDTDPKTGKRKRFKFCRNCGFSFVSIQPRECIEAVFPPDEKAEIS